MDGRAILTLENVSKYYTNGSNVVVGFREVNLSFRKGEFVAITGESGSGKSTLAHVIGGILPYESGEMYVDGRPTSHYDGTDWEQYRRDQISYISQDYGILPGNTVMENMVSVLCLRGMSMQEARERSEAFLKKVELWPMKNRRAAKLSSGQKQRLSIARALAKPAQILIADEPTGNLDPENSRVVIQLLAEAAKERLVLLITHEYEEAAEYVNRKIVLQDGRIVSDSQVREMREVPDEASVKRMEGSLKPGKLGWYAARLQMKARPIWTILMVLFFALTALSVFAILGTFYVSLDSISSRFYDNSAFRNGDRSRISVKRSDGAPMTDEDYERLRNVKWVNSLERYDLCLDVNYYYIEGDDYEFKYRNEGTDERPVYRQVMVMKNHNHFIHTVPILPEGEVFLKAGELPENMYQVVAVGDESLIGTTIRVYISDQKNWGTDTFLEKQMVVVGVTDYGSGLYFSDQIGRLLNQNFAQKEGMRVLYDVNMDLEDDEVGGFWSFISKLQIYSDRRNPDDERILVGVHDFNDPSRIEQMYWTGSTTAQYYAYLELSENMFDQLALKDENRQASLMIMDYSYTDRVIAELKELGYEGVSPYRVGSVIYNEEMAQMRKNTLGLCILAMVVILSLQLVIVRAMFALQMGSYRNLRDLGMSCQCGAYSLVYQMLVLSVVGEVIGIVGLLLCGGIPQVANLLKYLTPLWYMILCLVHLAASMLSALWMRRVLRKRIYPFAVNRGDLDWKDEEVSL